jgi:8-oxo-dGTP diphosphatase
MILATLCYIKRDKHTLMLYRNKKPDDIHKGKWDGLGGKFETGESPEDCVIREMREESGLEIRKPRLHGLLLFPDFFGDDWYVFVYTAAEFSGDLIDSAEGTLEWIPDEDLSRLNLWESDAIFFEWIRSGKFFSAKFIYDGDKMKSYEAALYPQEV